MPRSRTLQSQSQSFTSAPKGSAHKNCKNSFGSCMVATGFFKPEYRYEGRKRYCDCGAVSPRITAWTEANAGRRFYGCRYYGQEEECEAFEWHDGEIVGRARDVIWHLKLEYESLKSDFEELKSQTENVESQIQNGRDDDIGRAINKLDVRMRAIESGFKEMKSTVDTACENVSFVVQSIKFQRNVFIVLMGLVVVLFLVSQV